MLEYYLKGYFINVVYLNCHKVCHMLNRYVSLLSKIGYTLCVWLISAMSWRDNCFATSMEDSQTYNNAPPRNLDIQTIQPGVTLQKSPITATVTKCMGYLYNIVRFCFQTATLQIHNILSLSISVEMVC